MGKDRSTTSSGNSLAIQVHPSATYTHAQSEHAHLPAPPCNGVFIGPSKSGKTCCIVDSICRLYRNVFARVYIWSPSVHSDPSWEPVRKYITDALGVDQSKEPCMFDRWDPKQVTELINQQKAVADYSKKRGLKKIHGILLICDDFSDDPAVVKAYGGINGGSASASPLNSCFTRGRHWFCSTWVSCQKYRLLSSTIRVNTMFMCVFRLRSQLEKDAVLEEVAALGPKDALEQMYETSTARPYGFWYIDLTQRDPDQMFYSSFEHRLKIADSKG